MDQDRPSARSIETQALPVTSRPTRLSDESTGVYFDAVDAIRYAINLAGLALLVAKGGSLREVELLCLVALRLADDLSRTSGFAGLRDMVRSDIDQTYTLFNAVSMLEKRTFHEHAGSAKQLGEQASTWGGSSA